MTGMPSKKPEPVVEAKKYIKSEFGDFADGFMPNTFVWALKNWALMDHGVKKGEDKNVAKDEKSREIPVGRLGILTINKKSGGTISFLVSNDGIRAEYTTDFKRKIVKINEIFKVDDKRLNISFSSCSETPREAIESALYGLLFIIERGRVKPEQAKIESAEKKSGSAWDFGLKMLNAYSEW